MANLTIDSIMVPQAHTQDWTINGASEGQRDQTTCPEGGSGTQEDAAAKEALEVLDLRGAWRVKHRVVGEENSTTCPYSHPSNFSLCQGNHSKSSFLWLLAGVEYV